MKIVSQSFEMKGLLDDDYTLYENGDVLHKFDAHGYPGGQNLEEHLNADQLKDSIKERLLKAASDENRELVRQLLNIN